MQRRGLIVIISAPSGGGKTTVIKELISKVDVSLAITATSRSMRDGEVNGKDYYFFTKDEFEKKLSEDFFWEHVNYCGNYYGLPKAFTLSEIAAGKDVILNIESAGMRAVKASNPIDVVTIFLMIKSKSELKSRLQGRGDSGEMIEKRLSNSANEVNNYKDYDYIVFNDRLDDAVFEIQSIIVAERAKRLRKIGIDEFVKKEFPLT